MIRTVVVSGALLGALSVPALAEWNIIKEDKPPVTGYASPCFVADRNAAPGEQHIAGPFQTRAMGEAAMGGHIACNVTDRNQGMEPGHSGRNR